MRIETRARARALQALYACEMRGGKNLDRVATQVWDDLAVSPEERKFAGGIVRTVAGAHAELDAGLMAVTDNWRLEHRFKPNMSQATRERKLKGWARAVRGLLASDEGEG